MKKIAIYPGSFNPFTVGHLNILEKSEAIFGEENVIIAVGENPEKGRDGTIPFLTIKQNLPSKNVEKYSKFLTDYVFEKESSGYDVTIIRGLRNGDDLNYEVNQLRFMEDMHPKIKIVFIFCDKQFEHVSSSAYRMLESVRPGAGHQYLAREYPVPTSKQVSDDLCVIFIDEAQSDIINKYTIMSKVKIGDEKYKFEGTMINFDNYNFSGTYVECLEWIKQQELKK